MSTDTRQLLLATARAYLDEHGLDGLTLREIARRAGVSHGAPRRHFPTLAALCSVVATQGFRELYADVANHMDGAGDDPIARFRASGRGYVSYAVANRGPFTLMFRPDRCDPADAELTEASSAAFAQLLFAVAEAQGAGWRPDDHTADLAGVVWAAVHGIAQLTVQGSLPTAVARSGGNPDLAHLTDLAQDLLGTTVPSSGDRP